MSYEIFLLFVGSIVKYMCTYVTKRVEYRPMFYRFTCLAEKRPKASGSMIA